MSLYPKPSVEEIKAYRRANDCSLFEARAVLFGQWRKFNLERLRRNAGELYTVDACRDVIADLLDLLLTEAPE